MGISYCVECDGPLATQKNVVVIGNTAEAYTSALKLTKIAKTVSLISDIPLPIELDTSLLEQNNIKQYIGYKVLEILGDNFNVNSIILQNTTNNTIEKLSTDFIFVNTGYTPSIDFAEMLGITTDGIISVDDLKATTVSGIFACGDVSKNENRQVVTACADGAIAAMNAIKYINATKK
jgi:thioredoxin reductase (NADPH)